MRLLVISDVHANPAALEAVLEHSRARGWDEVLFLGDAVGYGEDAPGAIELLQSLPTRAAIRGNHEAMLDELRSGRPLRAGPAVLAALERNLAALAPAHFSFLDELQEAHLHDDWGAVHGALRTPFEYLISVPAARANASHMKRSVYFVGHTHVPAAFVCSSDGAWRVRPFAGQENRVRLGEGERAFLNPGSVSLPRDRIPAFSYGIFDEEAREFVVHRLPL